MSSPTRSLDDFFETGDLFVTPEKAIASAAPNEQPVLEATIVAPAAKKKGRAPRLGPHAIRIATVLVLTLGGGYWITTQTGKPSANGISKWVMTFTGMSAPIDKPVVPAQAVRRLAQEPVEDITITQIAPPSQAAIATEDSPKVVISSVVAQHNAVAVPESSSVQVAPVALAVEAATPALAPNVQPKNHAAPAVPVAAPSTHASTTAVPASPDAKPSSPLAIAKVSEPHKATALPAKAAVKTQTAPAAAKPVTPKQSAYAAPLAAGTPTARMTLVREGSAKAAVHGDDEIIYPINTK